MFILFSVQLQVYFKRIKILQFATADAAVTCGRDDLVSNDQPHWERLLDVDGVGGGAEARRSRVCVIGVQRELEPAPLKSQRAHWCESLHHTLVLSRAEFPIQLVGRMPHQLSGLPHQLCALPHQLLPDFIFSGFQTNIFHCRLVKLSDSKTFCHLNSSLPAFPGSTISWHGILPHQLFLKSSTHGCYGVVVADPARETRSLVNGSLFTKQFNLEKWSSWSALYLLAK